MHSVSESEQDNADLTVVNYQRLLSGDEDEELAMYTASSKWGFFYLDLGDFEDPKYLEIVRELFDASKTYFEKSLVEKLKDTRSEPDVFNICGYKPMGIDTGNVKNKKDGCEGLRIPIDLVYNPEASPHLAIPPGIQPSWSTITHFTEMSYTIASLILQRLSASLNLTGPADLRTHHLSTSSSTSTTVLQHYPLDNLATNTSAGHFAHTDAGSVSILFTSAWGLQAFDTEHDRWKFVAPRAHCAVVNIGDSLRFLAGLRLASCLHRVVPCGRWTAGSRYSCIFFLRPHKEAEFRDAEGRLWRADEWLNRKFGNYRLSHGEQNENTMATGRTNFKGLWREEVV